LFLWTDSDCSGRAPRMGRGLAALALFFCLLAADVRASGDQRSGYEVWTPLVERLVADGFAPGDLRRLFSDPVMVYDPQVMARKMSPLLDAKLAPPEPKAAEPEVDARYLNPILLAGAYGYLRENKDLLRRLRDRYGVPEEVLVALLLVETKLGLNTGTAKAAWALANMALARSLSDIEPYLSRSDLDPEIRVWLDERTRQKSDWAYEELEALLRYAEALGRDPLDIPGSAYGAIGQCQFMPTNALAYGGRRRRRPRGSLRQGGRPGQHGPLPQGARLEGWTRRTGALPRHLPLQPFRELRPHRAGGGRQPDPHRPDLRRRLTQAEIRPW